MAATTLEEAVYSLLVANAGVLALLSTRIYPLVVPQDASMPALAYQRISSVPVRSHSGFASLTRTRMQITCEAATYASAKAVAVAVRRAVESYVGTVGSVSIRGAFVENESDSFAEGIEAPVVRIDVAFQHNEA